MAALLARARYAGRRDSLDLECVAQNAVVAHVGGTGEQQYALLVPVHAAKNRELGEPD
jgi:hypothetical protein